jgi:murein DD-endopeptidase MepM/ murein hydrolase activator NlpD
MKGGWLVKIIPPAGYSVWRFEFTPLKLVALALVLAGALAGVGGSYLYGMWRAEARVHELRTQTADQHDRLTKIDQEAAQLDAQLRDIQHQNRELRSIIGVSDRESGERTAAPPAGGPGTRQKTRADEFSSVEDHLRRLRADSARMTSESAQLREVTLHILNVRHLEDVARSRVIAAIPSISPTGRMEIASGFGFRYTPWPEFHRGLDLVADYGDSVRATAAGTVVEAGYDGGFGNKVDIDHGNGYHTWYAHLSRIDVHVGQRVTKGEAIAAVGSTGASTGPHLHYQLMHEGEAIDPAPFLSGVPPSVLATLPR